MRILGVLVLFCLLLCKVHSKPVALSPGIGGSYLWTNPLLWVDGLLPGDGDDVQIVSSTLLSALSINISTAINLNSLVINTSLQTTLYFTSISITSNFSCVGTAFVDGTLFFAASQTTATLSSAESSSLSFVNTTINNNGTVNYQASVSSVQASVFWNFGTWNFDQSLTVSQTGLNETGVYGQGNNVTAIDATTTNFNDVSTFINFGTLNLNSGNMTFYLNFNNSGTINAVGTNVYIADQKTSTIHLHNGTMNLDQGSSWNYESRTYAWCTANAKHTGAGFLVFAGTDQEDLVTAIFAGVDASCDVSSLWFDGYVSTAGSATFIVSIFQWNGGAIASPLISASTTVASTSDATAPTVDGATVIITQAYFDSGSITGTGSIYCSYITLPSTEETGSVTFDGIKIYLNGTMSSGDSTLALTNGGKFTVLPNAQLYVNQSLYQFSFESRDNSSVSLDNQGYIQLQTSGSDYNVYVDVPVTNEGTIEIKNVNNFFQDGGQVTFANTYTASASGKLIMNIFSNVSGDYVYYYPGNAPCTIGGQLQLQFHYTPTIGDYYTFFQYQNGINASQCSGTFTVSSTPLPTGQVAKVFYGIQSLFPEDFVAVVVVCASTDANCSAPQSAGGILPNTTTPTTTTTTTSTTTTPAPTPSPSSSTTSSSTTVLSTTGGTSVTYTVTVQVPGTCNMFATNFNASYFLSLGISETGCNDTSTKRAATAQVGLQVTASSSASTDQVKQSVVQALASGGIQGATVSDIKANGSPNNNSAGSLKITFVSVIATILVLLML